MCNNNRKLIFNPVLPVPWTMGQNQGKKRENPNQVLSELNNVQGNSSHTEELLSKVHIMKERQRINQLVKMRKIQSLLTRFPGLKKYQARAALTLAKYKLEKAIIILELMSCYQREVVSRNDGISHLQNIRINLSYSSVEQDPVLRNVSVQNSFLRQEGTTFSETSSCESTSISLEDVSASSCYDDNNSGSCWPKVGVVIKKTGAGYEALPLVK